MNVNKHSLFWGVLLLGAGMLVLAEQMGYLDRFAPELWIGIFAVVSVLGFLNYVLSGWRQWGWLFPAGVFGGLAVIVALAIAGVDTAAVGAPLFIGLILPFAAAYLLDRTRNWWALIPGGVMVFLALTTLLVDTAGGAWVGAMFLFMVALSFLVVYLNNRTRIWALIVAYATGVLGLAPLMASGGRDAAYFGPLFLFAIALPFYYVYIRFKERWWAIIPAGALTVVAIISAFAISGLIGSASEGAYANALLMGGLAATFAVLWLRHNQAWARIVAIVLAALAVVSVFFVSFHQIYWPLAIILVGGYLLWKGLRPRSV